MYGVTVGEGVTGIRVEVLVGRGVEVGLVVIVGVDVNWAVGVAYP